MKDAHRLLRAVKVLLMVMYAATVMALLANVALGQLVGRPDRGYKAGNSYSVSDIENVNLSGGNVTLNIPLASLPAGRGDASGYSISLRYDSKLWDAQQEWNDDGLDEFNDPANYTRDLLELSSEGGWKVDYGGYELKVVDRLESGRREDCHLHNTNYNKNSYRFKVEMKMPGGGTTAFRPSGYTDFFNDGFFEVNLNGYIYGDHYAVNIEGEPACQYNYHQSTTAGMTYYSTDGSGIRLFVPYYSTGTKDWTMYFPDGRVVEYLPADDTSIFQRVTDRNGNRTVVKSGTYNGLSGTKIEDSTGRFIFLTGTSEGTKIYQFGPAGEPLETTITWKEYFVFREYKPVAVSTMYIPPAKRLAYVVESFQMVDEVILPEEAGSLKYEFTYHADETEPDYPNNDYTNGWGELASVKVPSGAIAEYKYDLPVNENVLTLGMDVIENSITQKDLIYSETYDGVTTLAPPDTWLYEINSGSAEVTAPDGSVTTQSSYAKSPSLKGSAFYWNTGLVYRTTNADGSFTEKVWEQAGNQVIAQGQPINPYVKTEFMTIPDAAGQPSLTAIKDFVYDQNMNVLEVREYDWAAYSATRGAGGKPIIPGGAVPKRKTINTYYNGTPSADVTTYGANYYLSSSSPRLRNVLKSTEIQDGGGNPKTRSEFSYDDPANKGNMTLTRTWDNTKGALATPDSNGFRLNSNNSISTSATYNSYGMPLTTTDANGNVTQITYGNVSCASGNVTDLYPTQTVMAYGTGVARTSTATYDCSTGLVLSATDEDNDVTNTTEYDDLGRPSKVISADGTSLESWTVTEYYDAERFVVVRSDLETVGDGRRVAIQHYDQLGRVRLSRTLEDASTEDPTNADHGIKVQTRYKASGVCTFDSSKTCSFQMTSNPYRAATSSAATNEESMGWTMSESRNDGRYAETQTFSGAGLPVAFGGSNSVSTGIVKTSVDANATTVEDQVGKKRRSVTNALGLLIRVDEPDASNNLGTVASPYQPTVYGYDVLNNLLTVTQASNTTTQCGGQTSCTQTRTFTYSSLSRLTSAANPESGTITYTYQNNGNLATKTDARGIVTTYSYDELNRVTDRVYTNVPSGSETPDVEYTYRTSSPAYGSLSKVESSVSTTEYTSFDILGRVTASKQTTQGGDTGGYTTGYAYNLSGALVEQAYHSGRVVKNILDNNGDLATVQSRKNTNSAYWNYANHFTYNAAGAVKSMQLGNGTWESTVFNSRLQPMQIALGKTQNATNLLDLDYTYGTTDNNGNVMSQTITVPTVGGTNGFTAVQTYSYDSVNRLQQAYERPSGWTESNCTSDPTKCWKQTFTFDRYGNRRFDEANTTMPASFANPAVTNPTISTSNNRLTSTGYSFDAAGNTTRDASDRKFTYDAENKQVKVESLSPGTNTVTGTVGEYFYDGDGRRVKKHVPSTGEVTIFVYDAAGKLIAEYSTIVAPQQDAKVAYLTNDHLGSPRINTDANGAVTSRHDYHPFGEEIATSQRTVGLEYADDTVRKQFTSYERDGETELDFAQSRYYQTSLGRFSTPDKFVNDTQITDPMSWNLYLYVRNNPLRFSDSTGEKAEILTELDRKNKTVTISVRTSIGLYTKDRGLKPNIGATVKSNIEAQIKKWAGSIKIEGGYTLKVNVDVTVKSFDTANTTDDVLRQDNTIQNVIELTNGPAAAACGGANSCMRGGDPARIANPDGSLPDVGTWNFNSAHNENEPAHEFKHIMGVGDGPGDTQGDAGYDSNHFGSQSSTAQSASSRDYTRVFGSSVDSLIREGKRADYLDSTQIHRKSYWPRPNILKDKTTRRCCN